MNSLSDEVSQAFEDALSDGTAPLERAAERHPVFSGMSACELIDAAVSEETAPLRRDQLWVAVIESYRQGPRSFWGPVLLQAIAPTLLRGVRQRSLVLKLARTLADRGAAVLIITHDVESVGLIADRVVVLNLGRVSFDDDADQVNTRELIHLMAGLDLDTRKESPHVGS